MLWCDATEDRTMMWQAIHLFGMQILQKYDTVQYNNDTNNNIAMYENIMKWHYKR